MDNTGFMMNNYSVSTKEDYLMPEKFCMDLDKKYSFNEFLSHLEINFDVQFVEVLNQQYDLNNFTGVIEARIAVVLKNSCGESSTLSCLSSSDKFAQDSDMPRANGTYNNLINYEYREDCSGDMSTKANNDNTVLEVNEDETRNENGPDVNSSFEKRISKPLCDQCGQVFYQQRTYVRHMLSAHGKVVELFEGPKPFKCSKCNLEFSARHALQKHEVEHNGYDFKCSRCKPDATSTFPSYTQLRSHYLKVHMIMKCKQCLQICYGQLDYNEHLSKTHQEQNSDKNKKPDPKRYTCTKCQRVFSNSTKYEEHLSFQREDSCFVCPVCSKSMKNKKCLRYHMTTHGYGTRKQCELCDRTFAQNCALIQHMRINHPDKLPDKYRGTISCELCGKVFKNRSSLVQHKQTEHEHAMRRCNKCKRVFTSSAALSNHMHHCV